MEAVLFRLHQAKNDHLKSKKSPFVCVSWAQSLDGFIAASPGVQTIISCSESMELTHELRAAHSSILVGIGTVLADNPRLNARLSRSAESPRPVVLDSRLRTPCDAKFLHIERKQRPIIFSRADVGQYGSVTDVAAWDNRRGKLSEFADVRRILSQPQRKGIDIATVLNELSECHVDSVMIEGGSKVLTSVIDGGHADFMIVTIAPRMFGGGVPAFAIGETRQSRAYPIPNLIDPHWVPLGTDIVLSGVPERTA